MKNRTCPCGTVFVDSSRTRPRKWCDECRRPNVGGSAVQTWTCGQCGVECSRVRVRGQRPKWCSQRCADLGKKGAQATCEQCGVVFHGLGSRFCSARCTGLSRRANPCTDIVHVGPKVIEAPPVPVTIVKATGNWAAITQGPCAWCGTPFTSTGYRARYCSKRCQRGAANRGGNWITLLARQAIYERDNWTCQLCYEPVDPAADPLSDWFPSLDHIVPQSHMLVPDHSPDNLRTAHRWCNAVRGDGTYHADFFEEAS